MSCTLDLGFAVTTSDFIYIMEAYIFCAIMTVIPLTLGKVLHVMT